MNKYFTVGDEYDTTAACCVSGQEVVAALGSFDTGSSAGLDGLRPAHLKDMTSRLAGEAGVRLVAALTKLVNLIIDGAVPRLSSSGDLRGVIGGPAQTGRRDQANRDRHHLQATGDQASPLAPERAARRPTKTSAARLRHCRRL